jgi:uncharacterized repeat protein (TIGR01451 family)
VNYRRLLPLIGIVALGVGIVAIVAPGIVPLSPDRIIVSLIGVLALVQALRIIQRRREGSLDEAETPEPERTITTPQPGEDFESVLGQFLDRQRVYAHVKRIREGLSVATVAVLTRFGGYTESEAKERVKAGTWTDDIYAASFLGGEDAPRIPLRTRLRDKFAPESLTQRKVRHTVDAIAAVVDRRVQSNEGVDSESGNQGTEDRTSYEKESRHEASTSDKYTFDEGTTEVIYREAHSTGHWRGVSVIALVGIGVGVLVEQPAVLLGGVVGIGYAAYARSPALPPGRVSIDRTLSTETPESGDEVTVTVTVTNTGDRVLPDIRIVDGVPEALSVASGSPRCGTALRPENSTTFSYTVTGRRGVHSFRPTLVIGRNLTSGTEEERLYSSDTILRCIPSLSSGNERIPLRSQSTEIVGREKTPTTGEGIEFAATREYRPGDPMRRIDWNRRARTRELTTIEFREERAASVVLLVDARTSAYVSPDSQTGHALDRTVEAAGQLFTQLSASGNRVGIAAAGADTCWLAPDSGDEHRAAARELLALHPALTPIPKKKRSISRRWRKTLRNRLKPGTQIIFLTPLQDDATSRIARQFDEEGFPVTILSPDPTSDQSPSHRLACIARQIRVSALRGAGIPVIDWAWDEPLDTALALYNERGLR